MIQTSCFEFATGQSTHSANIPDPESILWHACLGKKVESQYNEYSPRFGLLSDTYWHARA